MGSTGPGSLLAQELGGQLRHQPLPGALEHTPTRRSLGRSHEFEEPTGVDEGEGLVGAGNGRLSRKLVNPEIVVETAETLRLIRYRDNLSGSDTVTGHRADRPDGRRGGVGIVNEQEPVLERLGVAELLKDGARTRVDEVEKSSAVHESETLHGWRRARAGEHPNDEEV